MHSYTTFVSSRQISATSLDGTLVSQIRAKQVDALQEIYHRYARLVHASAWQILKSKEEAEDVTQEIFLKLWHSCRYDPRRGSFKNFLVMRTRSRAIDRLRSRQACCRTAQRLQTTIDPHSLKTPIDQAVQQQIAQTVREALHDLSMREREVLENAYYNGMSQSEIADRLDIPLGTVKSRVRHGLKKLREAIDP